VARGLDFILAEAGKYGIKLTPVLINSWKQNNGVPQFEQWCGTAGSSVKPRPDIDVRPEAVLNATERLQTAAPSAASRCEGLQGLRRGRGAVHGWACRLPRRAGCAVLRYM
jgi:hypothetical protein